MDKYCNRWVSIIQHYRTSASESGMGWVGQFPLFHQFSILSVLVTSFPLYITFMFEDFAELKCACQIGMWFNWFLYPRPMKLEGGYTGFTLSVCPSICRRHGFRSVTQVCFGISFSNFKCIVFVAMGRSLYIFSHVTFKMAAWQPYWIFRFPDSNFSLALDIECKLHWHIICVYGKKLIIPPHNEVVGGYIGFTLSVHPSVRLSIHPSRIPCPLCSAYSSGWIRFIFIHLIKQLQKVCGV